MNKVKYASLLCAVWKIKAAAGPFRRRLPEVPIQLGLSCDVFPTLCPVDVNQAQHVLLPHEVIPGHSSTLKVESGNRWGWRRRTMLLLF